MGKFFGTDGIRGLANDGLDVDLAMKVGKAAAEVLAAAGEKRPLVVIGKDTRVSSDMFEAALAAGICAVGGDVLLLGVVPTPAVAYLTVKLGADAGVMISASHNPYEHNGIKLFSADGFKLSDAMEEAIEAHILEGGAPLRTGGEIGGIRRGNGAVSDYIGHLAAAAENDLSGLKILVDCANGSASATAERLFSHFKAQADIIFDKPDGRNINDRCGSTHLEALGERVTEGGYDAGIAFDGDADRCLVVNERGEMVDGDHIMAICGTHMRRRGALASDTIVATVMSNLGFHKFAEEQGLKVIVAPVGDRYVLEEMRKGGYVLGGEQSGHLIFLEESTTGDGQLTAVKFLSILAASGKRVSELDAGIRQYPQVLKNIRIHPSAKEKLSTAPEILKAVRAAETRMGTKGRILVRPSGTEALVRVMVEGEEEQEVMEVCDRLVSAIEDLSRRENG